MKTETKVAILIVVFILAFIAGGYITDWLWGWVIPDVFAGAVAHGTLPAAINWGQGIKISLFFWVFAGGSSRK